MAQRSLLRSTAWRWYVAAGSALTAVYFLLPAAPAKLVVWPAIGWSSVAAICLGLRLHKPDAPAAWYLLAAGVATFIVGDNLYSVRHLVQHAETLFPSYVDIVYLAMYPLLIVGLS